MADPFTSPTDSDFFNITIEDTSPTISYSPFADTFDTANVIAGWNPFFTGSGLASSSSLGLTGQGTSLHETSADGAKLSIQWNGEFNLCFRSWLYLCSWETRQPLTSGCYLLTEGFSPPLAPKSFRCVVERFDGNNILLSIDAVVGDPVYLSPIEQMTPFMSTLFSH